MKILVVDIETTGFYPSDAIVEIGISLVDTVTRKVILVFDEVIKEKKFTKWKHKNAWIFQNTTLTVEDVLKAAKRKFDEDDNILQFKLLLVPFNSQGDSLTAGKVEEIGITFDKGDWNWCPVNKGTEKQFECHKSITPEMVINQIQHLL